MDANLAEELRAEVAAGRDDAVALRRDLHAHPELSGEEHRTTAVLRGRLAGLGLVEAPCPTPTGAVFTLAGGRPGRTVLLRADIDALPVREAVEVAFRSRVDGVMHACGHDGHAAILVAAAAALAARAESLPGRYAFVLQPAEETMSGARAMVESGLLDSLVPQAVIGLHLASQLPTGLVGHRAGVAMAACHSVRIDLSGTGGHVALSGGDGGVILAAAMLARRLGEVVEGLELEGSPAVCAAGRLAAGSRANIVPTTATIEGSVRTFSPEQGATALARLRALADAVAGEHGVAARVTVTATTPAVVNDAATTARAVAAVEAALGAASLLELPPMAPSDDVAELLARVPGVYLTVGARPGPRLPPMHHAPDFAIDEAALEVGSLALAAGAVALAAG